MQVSSIPIARSYPVSQSTASSSPSQDMEQCLKKLRQEHPELNIRIAGVKDREDVKNVSQSSQGAGNVVIDSALLQKMAGDEALYSRYSALLGGIEKQHRLLKAQKEMTGKNVISVTTVIDENGNVSNCVASKNVRAEAPLLVTNTHSENSRLERFQDSSKKGKFTINYKFNYGSHMARLARAKSIQNVKGVIQSQYSEISRARSMIENKSEAFVTIQRIRGVIAKGNLKVCRMRKEEDMNLEKMSAEKKARVHRARELAEKLRRKIMAREGQEQCQTLDVPGILNGTGNSRYDYAVNMYQAGLNSADFSTGASLASGSVSSMGGAGGADISFDISV